jgi:NitT/TauT family transport system permease protein
MNARRAGPPGAPDARPSAAAIAGPAVARWRTRLHRAVLAVAPVLGAVLLWQACSMLGLIDRSFFPPPSRVLARLWDLLAEGGMLPNLAVSLHRFLLGFLLGAVPGVLFGLLMGWIRPVRMVLDPIITLIYPIPRIAILPLFLVIFGLGSPPIVAITALICFFPAVVTTYAGVRGLDPNLPLMARNIGATRRQVLTKIALPAALPVMFAGLRLSLGLALTGEVAAEFVAATNGIGAEIWRSWQIYRIDDMYANIVAISAVGVILSYVLLEVQRRLLSWDEGIELTK